MLDTVVTLGKYLDRHTPQGYIRIRGRVSVQHMECVQHVRCDGVGEGTPGGMLIGSLCETIRPEGKDPKSSHDWSNRGWGITSPTIFLNLETVDFAS